MKLYHKLTRVRSKDALYNCIRARDRFAPGLYDGSDADFSYLHPKKPDAAREFTMVSARANLSHSDFSGARFRKSSLEYSSLRYSDFSGADFSGADLSGANFDGADLSGADFTGADLSLADLSGTKLSGTNFTGANLSKTSFYHADISQAITDGADLSGASLHTEETRRHQRSCLVTRLLCNAYIYGCHILTWVLVVSAVVYFLTGQYKN